MTRGYFFSEGSDIVIFISSSYPEVFFDLKNQKTLFKKTLLYPVIIETDDQKRILGINNAVQIYNTFGELLYQPIFGYKYLKLIGGKLFAHSQEKRSRSNEIIEEGYWQLISLDEILK